MIDWLHQANTLAGHWGVTFWRASWQCGIFLVLVWLVSRAFPKLPPGIRCWLWRLAYLKFLVALVWQTAVNLPILPANRPAADFVAASAQPVPASRELALPVAEAERATELNWALVLFGLWFSGAGLCLRKLAKEWRCMKSLIAEGRPAANEQLAPILADLGRRLKLRRWPRVIAVDRLDSPLVFGILRPAVILPAKVLTEFSAAECRIALAHELSHVKRLDLLWTWVPAVVQALFFFHPLVWFGTREWRVSQEMACDEKVLRTIGTAPREYGHVLLKLLARAAPRGLSAAMSESGSQLQRRLEMMGNLGASQRQWIAILLAAGLGLIPWRLVGTGRSEEDTSVRWGTAGDEVAVGLRLVGRQVRFQPGTTMENRSRQPIEIRCPGPARWTAIMNPRSEVELQLIATGNQLERVSTLRLGPDQTAPLFACHALIYLQPEQMDAAPADFGTPVLKLAPGRYRLSCALAHPFLTLNGHRWPGNGTGSAMFDVERQSVSEGRLSQAPIIAWGTPVEGLQAGLAFAPADNRSDPTGGVDLDFYVRNLLNKPLAFTFRPIKASDWVWAESADAKGACTLVAAEQAGAFVTTVVLDPSERFILGHPSVPFVQPGVRTCRIHAEIHQQAQTGREGTLKPWSIDLGTGQLELSSRPSLAGDKN